MPKYRRYLSAILAVWLCVMLVAFTYTWVSRNWTPSVTVDDVNIASSGALVISLLSDNAPVYDEVPLNDVIGLDTFTFRQVSSQDGENFFFKNFSPTLTGGEAFYEKITEDDVMHKKDYIEAEFCLKLDGSVNEPKLVFIHPQTMIEYTKTIDTDKDLNKAIRISLTYEKEIGTQTVKETVILADLGDDEANKTVENDRDDATLNINYRAVLSDADMKTDSQGALGYQTVHGLDYFNCGRENYIEEEPGFLNDENYKFYTDEDRALFTIYPGEQNAKWITMRIWLEGQDENCTEQIAGKTFDMVLKFDSSFIREKPTANGE